MSSHLTDRYGRRQRPRWFWPLIALVGCSIGVAFAAWVGFQPKPVSAQVFGYEVKSDQLVTVKLDVVTPKPVDVVCTVIAHSEDHAVVGEKSVDVPAGQRERRITIDIATERRAVTGVLRTCEVAD